MVFSTIIFLLRFLPITLALYYLAPPKLKNTVLFLCSLVFYCWGEVRFFPVMLALILINYLCGLGLERFEQNKPARLILLLIALAGSLGMLFYFKYANFLLSSINAIFGTGFAPIQGISVLPLGISFYTFQTLSYTIDVYRRDVKTEHNIIDFGAYVVMFPQLIAGPIVKYRDVSDRLHVYKGRYELKQIEDGMTLFTFGLAKKVLLADAIGALWTDIIGVAERLIQAIREQEANNRQHAKDMGRTLDELRAIVSEVERIRSDAQNESHTAQQAALSGVNRAQQEAEQLTLRNIDKVTKKSTEYIDSMVQVAKRRIERLALITLPDKLFNTLKWVVMILLLFILSQVAFRMIA